MSEPIVREVEHLMRRSANMSCEDQHRLAISVASNIGYRLVPEPSISEAEDSPVIDLGPHERMTPDQALACATREPWDKVLIVGFHKDDEELIVRSSHMSREFSLWITEHLKLYVLGRS